MHALVSPLDLVWASTDRVFVFQLLPCFNPIFSYSVYPIAFVVNSKNTCGMSTISAL